MIIRLTPVSALKIFFTTQAIGLSLWLLRIPEVKTTIGLSLIDLSFALFMQPLGMLFGFFLASSVIKLIGNKKSCLYFGPIFILSFVFVPFANNFLFLATILFLSGLICATVEVSMNTIAANLEKNFEKRMMSGFHAFWSFGALVSGIIVTSFSALSISFVTQQLSIIPPLMLVTIMISFSLPKDTSEPKPITKLSRKAFVPSYSILLLCIMPFGALLLEGAMMEWTAVFKANFHNINTTQVGLIFCSFTIVMTLARFFGDQIADKLNIKRTIIFSMGLSSLGMLIFALNSSPIISILSASLVGAGIANIYPITMSLVAAEAGIKERNVSLLAFISFTAFLISAPLIGLLGENFGLDKALAFIAPTSLLPIFYLYIAHK